MADPAKEMPVEALVVTLSVEDEKIEGYYLDGKWWRSVKGPDVPLEESKGETVTSWEKRG
jgi:hypothetical protein